MARSDVASAQKVGVAVEGWKVSVFLFPFPWAPVMGGPRRLVRTYLPWHLFRLRLLVDLEGCSCHASLNSGRCLEPKIDKNLGNFIERP